MALLYKDIGIDLGTVNILIYQGGEIVLHEPCLAAIEIDEQKLVAIGQEARDMYGRVGENIEVMRPLRDGVIADYEVTERMLSYFIAKVCGPLRLFKPRTMVSVPWGVTSVESRAVHEAAMQAGSRESFLIPEPLAGAIGAGLPIQTPTGNMVVDLGGGITEAAVLSMNSVVAANSARLGGIKLDEAIVNYTRKKYGLVIGEPTAEEAKIRIGAAIMPEEDLTMEVQGRDQVTGLPRSVTLSTGEVVEAMQEPLTTIVGVVKGVLEKTPPELASDIIDRGMVLCGGVALLRGIDKLLTKETGVPAYLAENPLACVALGAGRALEQVELYRRALPAISRA
ncbi:MAG: rod shape-determining protein [Chloroflexi bacterium]|nr:rod shape-determining protein [Chloroflexota bacterium]